MNALPIDEVLDEICRAFSEHDALIVEAPPGAGKTTRVPLSLLEQIGGPQKILLLEPRRLAAKNAASRMAAMLGEPVGKTVGYRIRLESRIGPDTRIEVITEGVLLRLLQEDPTLADVAVVIFDEFHERSVEADTGLALALHSRQLYGELREQPLKLVVMSATLNSAQLQSLLPTAPVVRSEGRSYPVTVEYLPQPVRGPWMADATRLVHYAVEQHEGSVLVFLPGQGEIKRLAEQLEATLPPAVHLYPLFGDMPLAEQSRAVAPPAGDERKVVLATNIAESSLTIEGITVVVDTGFSRVARYDPNTAMTRLQTRRIAKANAEQRAGRAGRLAPGVCYRLWTESEQAAMAAHPEPDILHADLVPLALQLLQWGEPDISNLPWPDQPAAGAYQQALDLLVAMGAASRDEGGIQLTPMGEAMADVPLHPRLAHMVVIAPNAERERALQLAALLGERDILGRDAGCDMERRVAALNDRSKGAAARVVKLARSLAQTVPDNPSFTQSLTGTAPLLLQAYPDRVAKRVGHQGDKVAYQLANGRRALLPVEDSLAGAPWLVVAASGGRAGNTEDQIYLAAEIDEAELLTLCEDQLKQRHTAEWRADKGRFVAERQTWLGKLLITSEPDPAPSPEQRQQALATWLATDEGWRYLPWSAAAVQLLHRVRLLAGAESDHPWPDWSEPVLKERIDEWLGPFLGGLSRLDQLDRLDLHAALMADLPWESQQRLATLAPVSVEVPSGRAVSIDYSQSPPVLAVKLQEMFGCESTPAVMQGKCPLTVHLLSPAGRPLQVTRDLAGFWRGNYREVRKEMRGRYPKHPWPEDPVSAPATALTKNALNRTGHKGDQR